MNYGCRISSRALTSLLLGATALSSVIGCFGEDEERWDPENRCLQIELVTSEVVPPAGVRTVMRVSDCDGNALTDLEPADLTVFLDDEQLRREGETAPIMTQEVEFEKYAIILLDLSDSIVQNNRLDGMIAAARDLSQTLLDQDVAVALYQFAGPPYFAQVQGFTRDAAKLDAAFEILGEKSGLGSTDLYGAIHRSIAILEAQGTEKVLTSRTLVLMTDGTDEAHSMERSVAMDDVASTEANVFAVGLGGDVDKQELGEIGKDGFEWVEEEAQLSEAFAKVSQRITDLSRSHYLVAICSPRVGNERIAQIRVRREGKWGELEVHYDADGFDLFGCDPNVIAYPCDGKQCGFVGIFSCGVCGDRSLCNEAYECEDACGEYECGLSSGVSCGTCGAGLACEDHRCVDPCADAECGTIEGVQCGDCATQGETFFCNADNLCEDACAEMECGLSNGMSCGTCDDGYGCDAEHMCVEV